MPGYTADEKLRLEQLAKLRRQWLKDQELSPREPVLPPEKPPGPLARFWTRFLEPRTLWRLYTYKAYNGAMFTFFQLVIPSWLVFYYIKYHLCERPLGLRERKPRLFPGDTIKETGEVLPGFADFETPGHH